MLIHCLGTTGFHPSPTRHTACYYLPEWSLVLDAGTGMFRLIERLLAEPRESLDILLSHAHLDHIVGLTFLVDALAVTSLKNIRLFGEQEKLAAVRTHLYNELIFPVKPSMEFVPLPGSSGTLALGEIELCWFPLEHPGGSIGYIVQASGKKLAYVTDTVARPDASYVSLIQSADLLMHECYFGDEHQALGEKTGHSWLSGVTQIVEKTQPKQTLLIHINPLAEILGCEFTLSPHQTADLQMVVAQDGMQIEF